MAMVVLFVEDWTLRIIGGFQCADVKCGGNGSTGSGVDLIFVSWAVGQLA